MRAGDVVAVCRELGIEPDCGADGVRLGTTEWRLVRGGGIAGNMDRWWLRPIAVRALAAVAVPLGPFTTRAQLITGLRAWLRLWHPGHVTPNGRKAKADASR